MRKIYLPILFFFILSCNNYSPKHVILSGQIKNSTQDSIIIHSVSYRKAIPLKYDGSFRDTLNIKKGYFRLLIGPIQSRLFLKNGYNLRMTASADRFITSVHFEGGGADNNNYIAEKTNFIKNEAMLPRQYFELEEKAFYVEIEKMNQHLQQMFENRTLDPVLVAREKAANQEWISYFRSNYRKQHAIVSKIEEGDPSPVFNNFRKTNGESFSLEQLPDGYLYFMVWATDCTECQQQLGAFNKLNSRYKEQNITFIGISVDEKSNQDTWKKMVENRDMQGIQLHTGNGLYRPFIRNFNITETPRFILVDSDRDIVSAYAPDPSSPALKDLLDEL